MIEAHADCGEPEKTAGADTMDDMLTTPCRVKRMLQVDSDGLDVEFAVKSATDALKSMLGFDPVYKEGRTEYIRQPKGYLRLKPVDSWPIKKVNEIKFDGGIVDSEKYFIENKKSGFITRTDRRSWPGIESYTLSVSVNIPNETFPSYEINYDAGWVTPAQAMNNDELDRDLPYDIEDACIRLALNELESRARRQDVSSVSILGDSTTFSLEGAEGRRDRVKEIVRRYKEVSV